MNRKYRSSRGTFILLPVRLDFVIGDSVKNKAVIKWRPNY
jgi:hypothetical protein